MDNAQIELYVQRGRLRERIGAQRSQLVRDLAPVGSALHAVDRARQGWQQTQLWLAAHPVLVALCVTALVLWRPHATVKTVYRGYALWRWWQRVHTWLLGGTDAASQEINLIRAISRMQ